MPDPTEPFLGSEALSAGRLTRHGLRSNFSAIYPNVYLAGDAELTAATRARAAWLWSRRRGVLAGRSAAALHGTKWIDGHLPAELFHDNRRPPSGVRAWAGGLADDEIEHVGGIPLTTPARTALDIACKYPLDPAVVMVDALLQATDLKLADVDQLGQRYPGGRGIRRARSVLSLADDGAQSPRETWLRLLLTRAGFPRPQTQIRVYDSFGVLVAILDMGWRDLMVGVDYEGDHHRVNRREFHKDIRRCELLAELGWLDVRITVEDTRAAIISRVGAARARRQ